MKERSLHTLPLDGGALPFHFINTVNAWRGKNEHEYLNSYAEFLAWCVKVRLLAAKAAQLLRKKAEAHPAQAENTFAQVLATRRLLYGFFSAFAAGNQAAMRPFFEPYNKALATALAQFEWTYFKRQLRFSYQEANDDLLAPLWMILKASHDLLLETAPDRVKECPRCGWIFLDATKNNKRRWCSPLTCGSSDKTKRYYNKKRTAHLSE